MPYPSFLLSHTPYWQCMQTVTNDSDWKIIQPQWFQVIYVPYLLSTESGFPAFVSLFSLPSHSPWIFLSGLAIGLFQTLHKIYYSLAEELASSSLSLSIPMLEANSSVFFVPEHPEAFNESSGTYLYSCSGTGIHHSTSCNQLRDNAPNIFFLFQRSGTYSDSFSVLTCFLVTLEGK